MASYNKVIMIGRLTRDPEKRYTAAGLALTSFSIAVDRPYKDAQTGEKKTDFFRCTAWRQKAEFVADYVQKGRLVAVEGRLETSESVGQDGQKRFFTDIVVENVEILESARDQAGPAGVPNSYNGNGNSNGGQSRGGGDYNDAGGEYEDEPAPARAPQRPAQGAPRQQAAPAPAPRNAPPQRQAPKPAPAQSAYPVDDDFDDSDPFADE